MDLKLTNPQYEFFTNKKKFCLFSGGIGSGKTFVGAYYVIKKIIEDPDSLGFIGANTYRQLHNSTLNALFQELDNNNLKFNYNKQSGMLEINKTKIICMSMENYQMIRGVELGWFWLDEVRDTREDAFLVLAGRLRDKRAQKHEGRLTTSPAGFNWLYDYFVGDKMSGEYQMIQASSHDNPFLPQGYIQTLKDSYDSKVYQQEVMGQFVNVQQGRIYYAFDRASHVADVPRRNEFPIWIGMDFNVSPFTAVICQTYDDTLHVIDEIYIDSKTHTKEMGETIIEKYGRGHPIVPDSTGKAMKTAGVGFSDHDILRQMGFQVISRNNPFRIDRYNAVNNLLEKKRLRIDNKCVKLIRDLEQVSYKDGTSLPDTKDHSLTHISDALGYILYHHFPIAKRSVDIGALPRTF